MPMMNRTIPMKVIIPSRIKTIRNTKEVEKKDGIVGFDVERRDEIIDQM